MESRPRPGLAALLAECGGANKRISASTVGFTIAPRLNAAGRLGNARLAARLLLSRSAAEAEPLARELCRLNRERQELEHEIWEQAHELLRASPPAGPIVLASEGWHQGVIGIAASRLAEEFRRPCVMICLDGENGKGSCRSYGGFNLFDALAACSDCLEGFGGHALAAGLTIKRSRVDDFRRELAEYYRTCPEPTEPALECELRIDDPAWLDMEGVAALERLEPYGTGNARPNICLLGAGLERITPIGGGSHLKLRLYKGGAEFDCVMFGTRESELGAREGDTVDAAFYPQINEFRGRRSVQLLVCAPAPLRRARRVRGHSRRGAAGGLESAELCPDGGISCASGAGSSARGGHIEGEFGRLGDWGPPGSPRLENAGLPARHGPGGPRQHPPRGRAGALLLPRAEREGESG